MSLQFPRTEDPPPASLSWPFDLDPWPNSLRHGGDDLFRIDAQLEASRWPSWLRTPGIARNTHWEGSMRLWCREFPRDEGIHWDDGNILQVLGFQTGEEYSMHSRKRGWARYWVHYGIVSTGTPHAPRFASWGGHVRIWSEDYTTLARFSVSNIGRAGSGTVNVATQVWLYRKPTRQLQLVYLDDLGGGFRNFFLGPVVANAFPVFMGYEPVALDERARRMLRWISRSPWDVSLVGFGFVGNIILVRYQGIQVMNMVTTCRRRSSHSGDAGWYHC